MAQFKAQIETGIGIKQAVSELAQHSGDDENYVLIRVAGLIEDLELSGRAVRFHIKAPSTINPKHMRNVEIQSAVISTRLREAARDGWQSVREVKHGDTVLPFSDVIVQKSTFISALEENKLPIPGNWTGQSNGAIAPATRAAVKQHFPKLTSSQWDKLFEREGKNGLDRYRLGNKQGKHVLYDVQGIKQWLATKFGNPKANKHPASTQHKGAKKKPKTLGDDLTRAGRGR